MSAKPVVLITGANGYIAGPVVAATLKAGYAVRGTVRSRASADGLVDALSEFKDDLEIVEVPDIVAPGAFDEAVKGVHAIAHLASPVSLGFSDPEPVLHTAVQGTTGILQSALKEPSIKSFVLMSSVGAIISPTEVPRRFTEDDWNTASLELVHRLGKDTPGPQIYFASKTAGEQAFWKFQEDKKPSFTMTTVNPTFVMGPGIGIQSASNIGATSKWIWRVLSGEEIPPAISPGADYVDVRDVARLVIFGIDQPGKANGHRYLLSNGEVPPQAAADVLREAYPERRDIIKVGTPGGGYQPDKIRELDGSKAVRATGQDYIPVKQSIIDAAKSFEKFL